MDTPNPAPPKKTPAAPQLGDKYNIKPPLLKRPRYCLCERSTILWCLHVNASYVTDGSTNMFNFPSKQLWSV